MVPVRCVLEDGRQIGLASTEETNWLEPLPKVSRDDFGELFDGPPEPEAGEESKVQPWFSKRIKRVKEMAPRMSWVSELCNTHNGVAFGTRKPDCTHFLVSRDGETQYSAPYITAFGELKRRRPRKAKAFSNDEELQLTSMAKDLFAVQPHRKHLFAYLCDGAFLSSPLLSRDRSPAARSLPPG